MRERRLYPGSGSFSSTRTVTQKAPRTAAAALSAPNTPSATRYARGMRTQMFMEVEVRKNHKRARSAGGCWSASCACHGP